MLTQEKLKELLTYDSLSGNFTWNVSVKGSKGKGKIAGTKTQKGYVDVCIAGKKYGLHRLAFLYQTGSIPECVDHKNTNKSDNRWENLRPASYVTNSYNYSGRPSISGVRNVYYDPRGKSKYFVHLKVNGKSKHYGFYETVEEAAIIAEKARKEMHGEFFWDSCRETEEKRV